MFRVLVSDKIAKEGLAPLLESGQVEIVEKSVDDAKDLDTYDALLVRSATKVTDAVMEKMAGLKIIGRAGVGVDNIDVPAATRRGLVVVNAPDANTIATAEHTFALMLAMVRKLCLANASIRRGEWDRSSFMGSELFGKTLGIIGFGRIGQEVAKRARAFEMNVLAYSRSITPEKAGAAGAQQAAWRRSYIVGYYHRAHSRHAGDERAAGRGEPQEDQTWSDDHQRRPGRDRGRSGAQASSRQRAYRRGRSRRLHPRAAGELRADADGTGDCHPSYRGLYQGSPAESGPRGG